jgi:hypothetical protein
VSTTNPAVIAVGHGLLWLGVAAFMAVGILNTVIAGDPTSLISFSGFPIVGALILSAQPRNGIGWLLYGLGLLWTVGGVLNLVSRAVGSPQLEAISTSTGWLVWGFMPLIGLFFPTGTVRTSFGRVLLGAAVVVIGLAATATLLDDPLASGRMNPLAVTGLASFVELYNSVLVYPLFFGVVVGVVIDIAVRWRRAASVERLQYRWLVFALVVVLIDIVAVGILSARLPDDSTWFAVFGILGAVVNLIPVSIYVAISRHGLYDIGRVISRTISYAIILVIVVSLYAGLVVGIGSLVPAGNPIPVAIATLIVASVFLPLLRWLQRGLDRRFDRARYDAQAVVDAFGDRLQTEMDPDTIAPELLTTLDRTFQPASIGMWTR